MKYNLSEFVKYRGKQLQIYFLVSWSGEKEPTMSVCLMIRSKLLKEHASVFFHTWIGPKTMQRQREDDWPIIHSFSGKVQTKQASFIVVAPALLKQKKLKVSCRVSMAKQWIQNSSRLSMPKKTMPKTSKLLLSGRCHTKWLQGETELERFSFFVKKAALVNRRQNAVKSAPRSGAQGEKSPKGTFPLKPQLVTRRSQLWTISSQPIACTASKSRELTTFDLSVFLCPLMLTFENTES